MQAIHFTPGALDPQNVRRHGTVAHMPLASGHGEFEVSCLYVAPGGSIAVEPKRHPQLLLVVNGKAETLFSSPSVRLEPSAGVGILMAAGERCQISSSTGAILLNLEAAQLEADACGISSPQRVMGQQWPSFESN
jgi:hypothetical protein